MYTNYTFRYCLIPGTGFKLGPVTGNMLADLAQGLKKWYLTVYNGINT